MSSNKDTNRRTNSEPTRETLVYEAPGWLSTEDLEQELFLAVVDQSNSPREQDKFKRVDSYFARDEPQTELQYRRSLLRLLADLRPQLAELVGGPRTCE